MAKSRAGGVVVNIVQDVTSERALYIVRHRVRERTQGVDWSMAGDDAGKESCHVTGEKAKGEVEVKVEVEIQEEVEV
jgi:hypothetical protein